MITDKLPCVLYGGAYSPEQWPENVWQEDVAWKRIRFAPSFCQVSAVEGKVATPHGPVLVCWKKEGARIRVSLALPRGISATVELPGRRREMVSGKKSWEVAS